jgi:hypothetical protein
VNWAPYAELAIWWIITAMILATAAVIITVAALIDMGEKAWAAHRSRRIKRHAKRAREQA